MVKVVNLVWISAAVVSPKANASVRAWAASVSAVIKAVKRSICPWAVVCSKFQAFLRLALVSWLSFKAVKVVDLVCFSAKLVSPKA